MENGEALKGNKEVSPEGAEAFESDPKALNDDGDLLKRAKKTC